MPESAYSYRDDPKVPAFDDTGPVAFMDGDFALCSFGARLITRFDKKEKFRICPIQSDLGRAVLHHYRIDPDAPETWLLLIDGKALTSMDAMIVAGAKVGGIGWLLQPLRLMPSMLRNWLYRRIARNRYALFGRTDLRALPDPALQRRLIG
ncbi:thiol-disulfide oxidoreductase DCC family protein [Halovulum sp. GXIMD14793]